MCHYCGCRHVSLIGDYIAEHESVTNQRRRRRRALDAGDPEKARRCIDEMAGVLAAHWQGEENGISRIMQREEEFADYVAPHIEEHDELAKLLATVDVANPTDQQQIHFAVVELQEHISKEEDGLPPASLTVLR